MESLKLGQPVAVSAARGWDRRGFLRLGGVGLGLGAVLSACGGGAGDSSEAPSPDPDPGPGPSIPAATLPPPSQAYSVLKRTSFGVHRDALAEIESGGLQAYLERQLAYESINDLLLDLTIPLRFTTLALPVAVNRLGFPDNAQVLANDLTGGTLFRAYFSKRQLYEVMVEFWSNHFSMYLPNGLEPVLKPVDDREVIRPYAMGKFRDLLRASAHSPAMLFSLDNFLNTKTAPNENYARELMELHTLGVDGGYTENDIKEVARCFTGWAINIDTAAFQYVSSVHDTGAKTVLGHAIAAGGQITDGEAVLDILASAPATASFIASKLCRRFIGDTPPATVINQVAQTFLDTDGDIRSMLRTLFASSAFLDARDSKFDRPIEFIGQIVRTLNPALNLPLDKGEQYIAVVNLLGQLPFYWAAPDGYPDTAAHWASTSGFLNRWRISLFAVGSNLFDLKPLANNANTIAGLVDALAASVLHRPLLSADRQTLIDYLKTASGAAENVALPADAVTAIIRVVTALLISSAYFQLR